MKFLNKVAYQMRRFPWLKKNIKLVYQYLGNILSNKKTIPKTIEQLTTGEEHLFGYYDKCPWNKNEDKIIYLRVKNANKNAASKDEEAQIILKDIKNNNENIVATTKAWNVQQGCMLQWLGPDFNTKILYNDYIDNSLKTVILNIENGEKKVINWPVYAVDKSGKWALTLDFYRLHRMRPGYGYCNEEDKTINEKIPNNFCIWKIDLNNNRQEGILKYEDLYNLDNLETMHEAEHKVNHIMINPSGTRFMFLHRWIKNGIKYTRLLTADIDGKNIYNLLDDGMVSHCTWKDDKNILGWARERKKGTHYFLIQDKTKNVEIIAEKELTVDGHPSYSPNGKYFITDTYPDFKRKQHIYLYNCESKSVTKIASIYSNIKYIDDCRCDLHPRWNYTGDKICFDGAQQKFRQIYTINIGDKL